MGYEITPGDFGAGYVRSLIEKSIGRTVARISFSAPDGEDGNERLDFHFTDGSVLTMIDSTFVATFEEPRRG